MNEIKTYNHLSINKCGTIGSLMNGYLDSYLNDAEIETINKKIKSLGKLDYIDRNILNELVDVIYINEERGVEVIFKYKNLYKDALRYLKS